MAVADHADFATEAEIARQVSIQGAPLISADTLLANQTRTAVTAPSTFVSSLFTINQIGYLIYLTCDSTANPVAGFGVLIQWFSSAFSTTIPVSQEEWWILPGTAGVPHQVVLRGPSKGDRMQITLTPTTVNTVNFAYTLLSNSRVYTRDDGRTLSSVGLVATGFTSGLYDLEAGLIANAQPVNVGIGGSTSRLLPLYSGAVTVHFETASGVADMELAIVLQADAANSYAFKNIYDGRTDANGNGIVALSLPRSQCIATLTNHNAAAKTLSVSIIAAEQIA